MKTRSLLVLLLLVLATAGIAPAQEVISEDDMPPDGAASTTPTSTPPADPGTAGQNTPGAAIPTPFPASRYEGSWSKNPFLLKTTPPELPTVNPFDDWSLAGMFNNAGKIRVSIQNKQTGEIKHLTNEGKEGEEFRLIQANFNRNRNEASAEIEKGTQRGTVKYDEALMSRPVTINNIQRPVAPVGQPGQPGAMPGQIRPGQPGQPQPVMPTPGRPGQSGVNPATGQTFTGGAVSVPGAAPQQGMAPGTIVNDGSMVPAANPPTGVPSTISRRRQLIPPAAVQPQP